jgi:preprotein translocase subunit SecF
MQDGFINIIVILGIIIGVLFFYSRSVQLDVYVKEGMRTTTRKKGDPEPTSDMEDNVSDLEIKLDKLKTSVSLDANRKNYENIIINYDDIISYSMMSRLSQIDPNGKFSDLTAEFEELNQMQNAKKTLNDLMAWLDKK